ncbi:hypothetical protein M427DRAFT_50680 [Gonapodya prolifera JEL478]|uniref:Uncharacterized protein n=1 Tax=Gonapodya prolifera (strain JEL478) TaxID=1344416 RepID=A0A139B025_GONPJ|nr:hypothetical protein M427DRAFT_50680 [Gonapodya prolifera JEL478]|eukprot:KXS22346.1 hypothetical protein M427DRAFT_50680 [Gonapodya prolifera JEL478]
MKPRSNVLEDGTGVSRTPPAGDTVRSILHIQRAPHLDNRSCSPPTLKKSLSGRNCLTNKSNRSDGDVFFNRSRLSGSSEFTTSERTRIWWRCQNVVTFFSITWLSWTRWLCSTVYVRTQLNQDVNTPVKDPLNDGRAVLGNRHDFKEYAPHT